MNRMHTFLAVSFATAMALTVSISAYAADCSLLAPFDQAIAAKDLDSAKALEAKILADSACGPWGANVRLRRATLEWTMAEALVRDPNQRNMREHLLIDAAEVFWAAANSLGELKFSHRDYADATEAFEQAIELIKNPTNTPASPGAAVIEGIQERAAQAKLLAADEEGRSGARYVRSTRDYRDGTIGGLFSQDVRGVRPKSVPLPINFETGKDKPTPIGLKAQEELLEAIKEQKPAEIIIVGHTDERGARQMNMRLSEARARAVGRFLASNGVTATVKTLGRGFDEPIKIGDPAGLTRQEIWALNRRVEWRRPSAQ